MGNPPVQGDSASPFAAGLTGTNSAVPTGGILPSEADGVLGTSAFGVGVRGLGQAAQPGVYGTSANGNGVHGSSANATSSGVWGENTAGGYGVSGSASGDFSAGVWGDNKGMGYGILGTSATGSGVSGSTTSDFAAGVWGANKGSGNGVLGQSLNGNGVHGSSANANASGVYGESTAGGYGVSGWATSSSASGVTGGNKGSGDGVRGQSDSGNGVHGIGANANASGVYGESTAGGYGVSGWTTSSSASGVTGGNHGSGDGVRGQSDSGAGIHGIGGHQAGLFDGDVQVNGTIRVSSTGDVVFGDFAERFNSSYKGVIDAGTVMVISCDGKLEPSQVPYDKKAAGVISGAGNFRPAILLGNEDLIEDHVCVALIGKIYCKVDANCASIEVGDLLTTSATPGHAMKASDPLRGFGAVIGKALEAIESGQGLIPILVALQ